MMRMANQKTFGLRGALCRTMGAAEFGDERLSERLGSITGAALCRPEKSIPEMMDSVAEVEGTYRFLRNDNVTFEQIVDPFFASTAQQMSAIAETLCIHDTTTFDFSWHDGIEGMGFLPRNKRGFLGHVALAATLSGVPIGIVGVENIFRYQKRVNKALPRKSASKESAKWERLVNAVHERLPDTTQVIHVMDREADVYTLLSSLTSQSRRFVIRLGYKRHVIEEEQVVPLFETVCGFPVVSEREVMLSKKPEPQVRARGRKRTARKQRLARLSISSGSVELKRPGHIGKEFLGSIKVNIVRVFEPNPPKGEEAVDWVLVTTESITTEKDVLKIVDVYRGRWLIEEYFKALKTGCKYEERQLESKQTLLCALGIFIPVALTLLKLRSLSRSQSNMPATEALTVNQVEVLRAISRNKIPKNPTVQQALLAIASLGGHLKNNGDPGWIVLGRGYSQLLTVEIGWNAARNM